MPGWSDNGFCTSVKAMNELLEPDMTIMKKLYVLVFLLAMVFPVGTRAASFHGDVNGDGSIDINDVTDLISYLLTGVEPEQPIGDDCVDLGLPSGTLWATHNVGATYPEEYGDYFAWGETDPNKEYYWWDTTPWVYIENGSIKLSKYNTKDTYGEVDNLTELEPEDDAAYVNMGPEWRMPSKEQIDELTANCSWSWTQVNGVNGHLITGPNGNTMFLPAAGSRLEYDLSGDGVYAHYWTRSLYVLNANVSFPTSGYKLYGTSSSLGWNAGSRNCGFTVRAVRVQ